MDLFRNDPNFYPFGSDGCGISSGTLLVDIIIVGKEFGEVFHRKVFSLDLFPEESSRSIQGNDCIEINLETPSPMTICSWQMVRSTNPSIILIKKLFYKKPVNIF